MAALNFPDSPTLNDEVVLGGKTYKWDGVKWTMIKVITPPPPTASAAAPSITIVEEAPDGVTFTLTKNDDNTAIISYEVDDNTGAVELAAAATSSNITVALSAGTYTLTAYATVVGEVATQSTAAVEIVEIGFKLLYDSNVSASLPATQIDITGLNITKDDELRIVYTFVGDDPNNGGELYLFANGETTQANYTRQQLIASSSSVSAERASNARILFFSGSRNVPGFADIKISNNDKFVVQSQCSYGAGTEAANIFQINVNMVGSGFTASSITSLRLLCNRTNGIATGSRIRLYKVNTGAA